MTKFCKECKWSKKDSYSSLRCHQPKINAHDSWALSHELMNGSECRTEREKGFWSFPVCGMVGKLWEQRIKFNKGGIRE